MGRRPKSQASGGYLAVAFDHEAEVVIVGAGPAGAACAIDLAEAGHDVLLVDQAAFPRPKPCGDGLTQRCVVAIERLGLGEKLDQAQEVERIDLYFDGRCRESRGWSHEPGEPRYARCLPRADLDKMLLDAALERGARLLHARVESPIFDGDAFRGITATGDGGQIQIAAKYGVAADGATSRMRREVFGRARRRTPVYAVRDYFDTSNELAPAFAFHLPLEHDNRILSGYGWVFPVSPTVANVGVGYFPRTRKVDPPLRAVLKTFVESLGSHSEPALRGLESRGEVLGSPVSVHFERDRCERDNLWFIGDAARLTDPLTGEGIAYALESARLAAEAVSATARSGRRSHFGQSLAFEFPRVVQDVGLLTRLWPEASAHAGRREAGGYLSLLGAAKRLTLSESRRLTMDQMRPASVLADRPSVSSLFSTASEVFANTLQTHFPLGTELVRREQSKGLGPTAGAATLLAADARGVLDDPATTDAVVAVEALRLFPAFLLQLSDSRSRNAMVNNMFGVLLADFAASRALSAVTRAGDKGPSLLAAAAMDMTKCSASQAEHRYDLAWSPASYARSVIGASGAPIALACALTAFKDDTESVDLVKQYGTLVGAALRLAEEVGELSDAGDKDALDRRLRAGYYGLPFLVAASSDDGVRRTLLRLLGEGDTRASIEIVRNTEAVDRVAAESRALVDQARMVGAEAYCGDALEPLLTLAETELGSRGYEGKEWRAEYPPTEPHPPHRDILTM